MKIAVILYTLRDLLQEDFWGTMEKVAEMGYKTVQISGLPADIKTDDLKAGLDRLGLKGIAPHVGLHELQTDLKGVAEKANALGCEYVVLPWLGEADYAQGWAKASKEVFEPLALQLKEHGLGFAYHNHSFEFKPENGRPGYDLIWESSDPALVKAELDCYWVKHGGGDPAEYIKRLSGRVPMTHWKDMTPGENPTYAEVGAGILDWPGILAACNEAGVEWAIVELDTCPRHPLESIKASREYMLALGLKD